MISWFSNVCFSNGATRDCYAEALDVIAEFKSAWEADRKVIALLTGKLTDTDVRPAAAAESHATANPSGGVWFKDVVGFGKKVIKGVNAGVTTAQELQQQQQQTQREQASSAAMQASKLRLLSTHPSSVVDLPSANRYNRVVGLCRLNQVDP